ncbi:hypothetical protein [Nocardiopsis aegyptia]|uniref:Uncharacterized protein n=1 Tax=Nocardiopsis aegyptia TaxID=220378 RepID=A0A7Z0ERZ3_9ACTN|nr:hypothetical protein [Nocardiopsis aegyptia]NYJ36250.1 hypothetical protein [Nocardiopsis aegyptia]
MRNLRGRPAVRPAAVGLAITAALAVSACGGQDPADSAAGTDQVAAAEPEGAGAPVTSGAGGSPAASEEESPAQDGEGTEDTAGDGAPDTADGEALPSCGGLWEG